MISILTVAGASSRFNRNRSEKCLKAIYSEGDRRKTCLYRLCRQCARCEKIIVVGGWQYEALKNYIETFLPDEIKSKLVTVFNPHFAEYASGYSIYSGIKKAFELDAASEIVFIEGDLVIDDASLEKLLDAEGNALTFNRDIIDSRSSVVLFEDAEGKFHYTYSYAHGLLSIEKIFHRLWNSGQAWKFAEPDRLRAACESFRRECVEGIGLNLVQRYFDRIAPQSVNIIELKHWFNCNTREDYARAFQYFSFGE